MAMSYIDTHPRLGYRSLTIEHRPDMSRLYRHTYQHQPYDPSPLRNIQDYDTDSESIFEPCAQRRRASHSSDQGDNGTRVLRRCTQRSVSRTRVGYGNSHFTEDLSTAVYEGTDRIYTEGALLNISEVLESSTAATPQVRPARRRIQRRLTKSHLDPHLKERDKTKVDQAGVAVDLRVGSRAWWAFKMRSAEAWLIRMGCRSQRTTTCHASRSWATLE